MSGRPLSNEFTNDQLVSGSSVKVLILRPKKATHSFSVPDLETYLRLRVLTISGQRWRPYRPEEFSFTCVKLREATLEAVIADVAGEIEKALDVTAGDRKEFERRRDGAAARGADARSANANPGGSHDKSKR